MKRTIFRIGTNAVFCILLLVMLVVSFNCIESPLEPIAPSSDIVLGGVSVFDKTFYYREVEVKAQGTVINSVDSTMSYVTSQRSTPQKIDSMKLKMNPSVQGATIGIFYIDPFSFDMPPVQASSISPIFNGTLPLVPAQTYTLAPELINDTVKFDYMNIETGTLTLSITNNLPIPVDFPDGITLRNKIVDANSIANFPFPTIAPGATESVPANVAGKLMRGLMGTDSIKIHTTGSSTQVTFSSASNLLISFTSTRLYGDSASAIIPPQTLSSTDTSNVALVDSFTVVETASFSAGSFQLRLDNQLGLKVGAEFIIDELHYNRQNITINDSLDPKTSRTWSYDGRNLEIQTTTAPGQLGTRFTYWVGIKTITSGTMKEKVTKNDFINASIIPGPPLVIKEVYGKIKTQIIPINSISASGLDFKDVKNLTVSSVQFQNVSLVTSFQMTGGYPMDYDFMIVAKSKGRPVDSLKVTVGENNFTRLDPLTNPQIPLSNCPNFNNFISKFVPVAPDSFYIHGSITLNPDYANPSIASRRTYDTTSITPQYDINFPCSIGMTDGILRDTVAFSKDAVKKEFTKAVVSGKLSFNFVNAIPLRMSFSADFLGNYSALNPHGQVLLTIAPTAPDDTIDAAQIDANGYSSAPAVSKVVINLNGDQMDKFNKADSLAIRFGMTTSNNGQVVKVRAYDYIRVYVKGDITYTVNKP